MLNANKAKCCFRNSTIQQNLVVTSNEERQIIHLIKIIEIYVGWQPSHGENGEVGKKKKKKKIIELLN